MKVESISGFMAVQPGSFESVWDVFEPYAVVQIIEYRLEHQIRHGEEDASLHASRTHPYGQE